jgi:hypothetical protein|nr:MAG TPA: hypothetical protein [Caudoviricetes sp.]
MAVVTRDDLMERIRSRIGDDTSDETLSLIEDFTDTFSDLETRAGEDWKSKYDELDKTWREKYKARFFQRPDDKETTPEDIKEDNEEDLKDESKEKSFDELFTEKGDNNGY